jgi:hypothetical protein
MGRVPMHDLQIHERTQAAAATPVRAHCALKEERRWAQH